MKIVIYGICKNEIQFAKRFAESIKNAEQKPDAVLLCDTGSIDGTQDILRSYGFIVYDIKLSYFRFDTARNISLGRLPKDTDIAVSMDLDDILLPNWRTVIEKYWVLGKTKMMAYSYINNWEEDGITPQVTIWGFKVHDPHYYYWKYPIHEVLKPINKTIGETVESYEQIMEHHPIEKNERWDRVKFYEDNFKEFRTDPIFNSNYGRELFFNKRWEEAIKQLKYYLNLTKHYLIEADQEYGSMQARSYCCRLIAECLMQLEEKDLNFVVSWYIKAVSESPYQREPWVHLAYAWFMIEDGLSAYAAIRKALLLTDKRQSQQIEDNCWDNRVQILYDDIKAMYQSQTLDYKNEIEGWMTDIELDALRNTASRMKTIVEIGSWKGRSTHALLTGCKGIVYAIDHFKGTPSDGEAHKEAFEDSDGVYNQFVKNVGHFTNLNIIKKSSEEAVVDFEENSIDMVFIDGDHLYESALKDINLWKNKATNIICGHDYNFPSVKKAVDESFDKVKVVGSIWSYKIKEVLNDIKM